MALSHFLAADGNTRVETLRQRSDRIDRFWPVAERLLRTRLKSASRCGEHHVLDEHAEIEPASGFQPAIDRHDQSHGRSEERVILRGLPASCLGIGLADSK